MVTKITKHGRDIIPGDVLLMMTSLVLGVACKDDYTYVLLLTEKGNVQSHVFWSDIAYSLVKIENV